MNIANRFVVYLSISLSCATALAGNKAKGHSKNQGAIYAEPASHQDLGSRPSGSEPWLAVDVAITPPEREVIQAYVQTCHSHGKGNKHGRALPPGLAKKVARGGQLPPGWQRKCIKGEVMPEKVYRQAYPLPAEVVAVLPPPHPGTVLVAISGKVVRLLQATREILDVFDVRI